MKNFATIGLLTLTGVIAFFTYKAVRDLVHEINYLSDELTKDFDDVFTENAEQPYISQN